MSKMKQGGHKRGTAEMGLGMLEREVKQGGNGGESTPFYLQLISGYTEVAGGAEEDGWREQLGGEERDAGARESKARVTVKRKDGAPACLLLPPTLPSRCSLARWPRQRRLTFSGQQISNAGIFLLTLPTTSAVACGEVHEERGQWGIAKTKEECKEGGAGAGGVLKQERDLMKLQVHGITIKNLVLLYLWQTLSEGDQGQMRGRERGGLGLHEKRSEVKA
ncbi:hypothetical protein BT69DRAFT_1320236 [Atractiella rhizophila]|nr:hypothetical protein BT69DRAFT_1320236 [Atractiella rhizophila]